MTEGTSKARLVNAYVAYDSGKGDLVLGGGAYGVPAQAMAMARRIAQNHAAAAFHGWRVAGVMIHDVRTGEQWAWPL